MTAFFETLAPIEVIFLVPTLMGALGVLITTIWQAVAGGFGLEGKQGPSEERPQKRILQIILAGDGFLMTFGLVGMALLRLAGAGSLWSVMGAVIVGVLVMGVTLFGKKDTTSKK